MGPSKLLGVIAFVSSSCAAMFYNTDAPCDFTDVHLDDEMFSKLLVKLPEGFESGPQGIHSAIPGIEFGGVTVHGLSKLRQFGPPIPYCANGKRMVQVDLYNDEPIYFSAPWKACSGDEGQLMLRSAFLRFTAQFAIVESSTEGVKLEFERELPVTTQSIRLGIEGAGRALNTIFEVLSALLPSVAEESWNMQFSRDLARAFRMALE
ncbi:uncharacterized protein LOC119458159 isoform X1 [Dermacentor silvarum]|uniref:uncharacterized protein LOC119458159 isoform X1 n=1 Tax=Dermacentor silvarum TaxID=543639 RepID=UPI0021019398|nr:uncharacterized protein LOC119458159 isoform X1 [Dermacentor silvarum]XP_049526761.1 uncharacterized protein LOC119458159 isoform X1 [Dermacentor silvarum]XP_049526762.1 uncharacterized protein LOC119458159 isoform X1 [Dermacentor silvarum]XP_049526763.1 uncharacterized protein LOC119458159 isoform X1 [Dermacentor silvarum]